MQIWIIITATLAVAYCLLIFLYIKGFKKTPLWQNNVKKIPTTSIAVIVPARNEQKNISKCLDALVAQNYNPALLEIIVVDDHSTDETAAIVKQYRRKHPQIKLINLAQFAPQSLIAYKKHAIATAISQTQQTLIVTTDADCYMGKQWLQNIAQYYEHSKNELIAAPVLYAPTQHNKLQMFQALDMAGMMLATAANIQYKLATMCNGANLAYTRTAFEAVNGFEGNTHLASGDDMLLMQKIVKEYGFKAVGFLKNNDAKVLTYPQTTFKDFVNQRKRWASKTTAYQSILIKISLLLVFLFNCSLVVNFLAIFSFINIQFFNLFLVTFLAKGIIDFIFLRTACNFFNRPTWLPHFFVAEFLHIAYIIGVGTIANFGKYEWKGRVVK